MEKTKHSARVLTLDRKLEALSRRKYNRRCSLDGSVQGF